MLPLTIIIALILLFILIFGFKIQFKKYLEYSILDAVLTKKYSLYSKKFSKDIDIYKSIDDNKINKLRYTPAFSFMLHNKFNIIVSSEFLNNIDDNEKNVLILHEIGHLGQYKNENFIKFLISFMLLLVLSSVGVMGIVAKSDVFLDTIAALLSLVILIFMLLVKSSIFNYTSKFEISADNFALMESNNKKALISLLLDALSYDLFQIDYEPEEVQQIKIHIDERLSKLDYLNAFNSDNDYYENH
ncbi:M48 family metalloprotease [Ferroplasma sp.]|uniref:M48 family metalloprotease n=1 Tax=Ferroplasma sp. TaxID=2591003 RepID=UPI00307D0BC4